MRNFFMLKVYRAMAHKSKPPLWVDTLNPGGFGRNMWPTRGSRKACLVYRGAHELAVGSGAADIGAVGTLFGIRRAGNELGAHANRG